MKTKAEKSNNENQGKTAKAIALQKNASKNSLEMVDNREVSSSQTALQMLIDHSPRMAVQRRQLESSSDTPVQQQGPEEEEELMQGKFTAQHAEIEDEELLQGKFETVQRQAPEEKELMQGQFETIQRKVPEDEEELIQGKFKSWTADTIQAKPDEFENKTGLPDHLKAGLENLSGISMDDVRVHYNSSKPADINAHAFTQGKDIHIASGQEKPLPSEGWHVVQQIEERVKPALQIRGEMIKDDASLEKGADGMGGKALKAKVGVRREELKDADPIDGKGFKEFAHLLGLRSADAPAQLAKRRGRPTVAGQEINVYNRRGNLAGRFIAGAQFDIHSGISMRHGHQVHRVADMNRGDFILNGIPHNRYYVRSADVNVSGERTYKSIKRDQDRRASRTTRRLRAGRKGAKRGIGHSHILDYARTAAACYNFAVGSFEGAKDSQHLQAAAPEYVNHRAGGVLGHVPTRAAARDAVISGPAAISAGRAAAIDALMAAAGIDITPGNINRGWYGGAGDALRSTLKRPLQEYVLRESGLRPNPDGKWAVGFRGQPNQLGSDHAWVKAIDPRHPDRYITFDTFPNYNRIQASRKKHSDPYDPRPDEVDWQINITGPTAPQWELIEQVEDVAFDITARTGDDRTNLDED